MTMHKLDFLRRCAALLLALLLALLMAGCGGAGEGGAAAVTQSVSDSGAYAKGTSEESAWSIESTQSVFGSRAGAFSSQSASAARQGVKETTKETKSAAAASASTTEKRPETTAASPRQETVALSVTCHNAVANGVHNWPGYSAVVPASGVIFENGSVAFTPGETVLDVLKRALKEQNIVLSEKRGYVRSINGLSEKLRGEQSFPQSGWLYQVNGEFPSVASDQYKLKTGDRVEWIYTCKPGDTKLRMQ